MPSKLNLIPILDSVFIFIFFLLMSANFIQLFEISSEVPIISEQMPDPSKEKPLALTLKITAKGHELYTGVPSKLQQKIPKKEGNYDNEALHNTLLKLKKNNLKENQIIIEPLVDIDYGTIVKIMDHVRLIRESDETLYKTDSQGLSVKVDRLFDNIIFGNMM